MSYDVLNQLADQLHDPNPKVRIRAARLLGRYADPRSIPELGSAYNNPDETPEVRKVLAEMLGIFRAMEQALARGENVEIPEPSSVREPRFSPETLRRILGVLAVVMVLLWIVNGVVAISGPGGGTGSGPGPLGTDQLLADLRARQAQLLYDVNNQRTAWQQLSTVGMLKCDIPTPTATALTLPQVDVAVYPELYQANLALGDALNRLTLAANNWTLGCNRPDLISSAAENLGYVEQAAVSLTQAAAWLDRAAAARPTAPPLPTLEAPTLEAPTEAPTSTSVPPTATTPALTGATYRTYILDMQSRIDAVMGARGAITLLTQYWTDVHDTGQSFGCSQPFNAQDLADYTSVSPNDAALDPRLQEIQNMLNIGFALARDSLGNFQQGCTARNFGGLLSPGEQRIQQAGNAMNQAALLIGQLQASVQGQP